VVDHQGFANRNLLLEQLIGTPTPLATLVNQSPAGEWPPPLISHDEQATPPKSGELIDASVRSDGAVEEKSSMMCRCHSNGSTVTALDTSGFLTTEMETRGRRNGWIGQVNKEAVKYMTT